MKRWTVAAAAVALLLAAGCSGGSEQPAPASSAPQPSASAAAPSPEPSSPGGAAATPSGTPCAPGQPSGTYRLEQFAGQGQAGLGVGKGGDVTVTFDKGSYAMTGNGDEPMVMTLADKATADLYLDGTVKGTYATSGPIRKFTVGSADGTAYLSDDTGKRTELDFAQVARVIGLEGDLAAACSGDRLGLAGTAAQFSLAKA